MAVLCPVLPLILKGKLKQDTKLKSVVLTISDIRVPCNMKRMGKALSEKQLRFPEGSKKKKKRFLTRASASVPTTDGASGNSELEKH